MLFPTYEEEFVVKQEQARLTEALTQWLCGSDLYGVYRVHTKYDEMTKYKNSPGFSLYYNSFRPDMDIYLFPYEEETEVLFRFSLPRQMEIFLYVWWGFVLLWSALALVGVLRGQAEAIILLLPLLMIGLSVLMSFIPYRLSVARYRQRIREGMEDLPTGSL